MAWVNRSNSKIGGLRKRVRPLVPTEEVPLSGFFAVLSVSTRVSPATYCDRVRGEGGGGQRILGSLARLTRPCKGQLKRQGEMGAFQLALPVDKALEMRVRVMGALAAGFYRPHLPKHPDRSAPRKMQVRLDTGALRPMTTRSLSSTHRLDIIGQGA